MRMSDLWARGSLDPALDDVAPSDREALRIAMFVQSFDDRPTSRLTAVVSHRLAETGHAVAILSATAGGDRPAVRVPRGIDLRDLQSTGARPARATKAFSRFVAEWKPDVVFAHGNGPARTAIIGRGFAKSRTRIITVQHTHATTFDRGGPVRRMITSVVLPRADLVTAVGPYVLQDLISRYPGVAARSAVLPPVGPEPSAVSAAAREIHAHPWFRGTERPLVVTCVGDIVERKGQATLIEALPMLRDALGDVRLLLVGREDDRAFSRRLRNAARKRSVSEFVSFAGYVIDPLPIIAHSDFLAIASHTEGGPMVALDAMACGVPVVSTDCPAGPRYLLDEGRAGVLVPVTDPSAMADAIVQLASQEGLRAGFVRRGLHQAANFDPRKVARMYAQAATYVCEMPPAHRRMVRSA